MNLQIPVGTLRLCGSLNQQIFRCKTSLLETFEVQQSIINGVGGRKTMFEKLLLAITITFSLNFFLQVRVPDQQKTGTNYQPHLETSATILVTTPNK